MITPSTSAQGPALNPLALEALENNQRQLDMDGVEVGVSRQALDELITAYRMLRTSLASDATPAPTSGSEDGGEQETLWCESCGEAPVSVHLDVAGLCAGCAKEQGE
jgi:hypothetical protein